MSRDARRRIALAAALPVLAVGLPVLTVLAVAGLVSWTVAPAVVLASAVRSLVVFVRLAGWGGAGARGR
ncbi:hypothetical protein [Kitasatospora sp. LaBMicrA B282]|uniref:hypothetical protein n=1 Tax=Kitasatospora sp. LaBMicrA B282 TaxID=3420949 RepID=UPI003D1043A1